jgi:hypothetical protein
VSYFTGFTLFAHNTSGQVAEEHGSLGHESQHLPVDGSAFKTSSPLGQESMEAHLTLAQGSYLYSKHTGQHPPVEGIPDLIQFSGSGAQSTLLHSLTGISSQRSQHP